MTCWLLAVSAGWLRRRLALPASQPAWRARCLGLGGVAIARRWRSSLCRAGRPRLTPLGIDGLRIALLSDSPSALWLMGFGLPSAILAAWLGTPAKRQAQWIFGAAASLIGALGVFGMQDAATFLMSWEIMSLGGAVMLLGENLSAERPARRLCSC